MAEEPRTEVAEDTVTIEHSPSRERYTLLVGENQAGYLDYVEEVEKLVLTHTVVYDQFGGRGLAAQLVKHVLDEARSKSLSVVPVCTYVEAYIAKHPEYSDLVAAPEAR